MDGRANPYNFVLIRGYVVRYLTAIVVLATATLLQTPCIADDRGLLPKVMFLTPEEIEETTCPNGGCLGARAFYDPKTKTIALPIVTGKQ